jgi:SAM-dependent methyltransferase
MPTAASRYDVIGGEYGRYRVPDPQIAKAIHDALGGAESVLNVGAGVGSYEPADRTLVAVEPSSAMIRQRPIGAAAAVRASAEHLPFADAAFDVSLGVLTIHHWSNRREGLREMARVARGRVVLFTWDPTHPGFWLVRDYFPEVLELDRSIFPPLTELKEILGPIDVSVVPIPRTCTDGFLGAYWRRPEAYLDPGVRSAISTFTRIEDAESGLARLREDLRNGTWTQRNAEIMGLEHLDLGYRLVVAACAT